MKQIPAAESQHSGGEEVFVFPLSFAKSGFPIGVAMTGS